MIGTSTSLLWDNSTKLLEITSLILDAKGKWLFGYAEEDLEVLAPLIWGTAPTEAQKDLLAYKIEQARIRQDIQGAPIEDDPLPGGTPEELFEAFFQQIDTWLNQDEVDFIQKSWEARTSRIKKLIKQRDEAWAMALAAKARQMLPEESTLALNLAIAGYALAPYEEECAAALYDILSNTESTFYKTVLRHNNQERPNSNVPKGVAAAIFSAQETQLMTTSAVDAQLITWNLDGSKVSNSPIPSSHKAAFSPDKTKVLTINIDAKLLDLEGNSIVQMKHRKENAGYPTTAVAFSHNGQQLLTGSYNMTKIWDLHGNETGAFGSYPISGGNRFTVNAVAFSPDGQKVLTGSSNGTVMLWNVDGTGFQTLTGHEASIEAVAFSPDGLFFLTGSEDESVILWDKNGNKLEKLRDHRGTVSTLTFSPDSKRILTGSHDKTAKLWDLSGKMLKNLAGHNGAVLALAFSTDGQRIVTGSEDNTAKLWELARNQPSFFTKEGAFIGTLTFSPDSKKLLISYWDGSVRLWNLTTNESRSIEAHSSVAWGATFSPDSQKILTGSMDKTVKIWNLSTNEISNFKEEYPSEIIAVAFSPDGQQVLIGAGDGSVKSFDLEGTSSTSYEGHSASINATTFSPDGTKVVACSTDKTVRLWNLDGTSIWTFTGSFNATWVIFSPDGQEILFGTREGIVRSWDLDGKEVLSLDVQRPIWTLAFSPNGQFILIGFLFGSVELWDRHGHLIRSFETGSVHASAVAFSPDGKHISIGSGPTDALWPSVLGEWDRENDPIRDWVYKLNPGERMKYNIDWAY